MIKKISKINYREVSSARLKSEFLSKLEDKIQNINQVEKVVLRPRHKLDIDASIRIIISSNRSLELSKRIAEAISSAKWEVFEELGELPAVEWEIEKRAIKTEKGKKVLPRAKSGYELRRILIGRASRRQSKRAHFRYKKVNWPGINQNRRTF